MLLRNLRWATVALLILLSASLAAPLLLTTQIVRFELRRNFPANNPSVRSAALALSGTLVARDLVIHDTGPMAHQPLIRVGKVTVAFSWGDLLSRRVRQVRAQEVTLYARANGPSQLSLLDLFAALSAESRRSGPPIWIGELDVRGAIHREQVTGLASGGADLPLALRMRLYGDRLNPSRQFRIAIGEVQQVAEPLFETPAAANVRPAPGISAAFSLLADIETEPRVGGARLVVHQLAARQAVITIEADTLREFVPTLPSEIRGSIEGGVTNVSASAELDPQPSLTGRRLAGNLAFAGLRIRMPGSTEMMLSVDDLSGAAKFDTPLPLRSGVSITIERLHGRSAKASIDADALRRHAAKLPADLHGAVKADLEMLDLSGQIRSGLKSDVGFIGTITLKNLGVRSRPGGKHSFALDGLTATGRVEGPIDRWEPAALKVQDGVTQWSVFAYGANSLNDFDASWRIDGQTLKFDRLAARIFHGHIAGAPQMDLITYAVPSCDLELKNINIHEALANISPEHLDADGSASGTMHLVRSVEGELSGNVDLTFDGAGALKLARIEEVNQMLVRNFGADLANLAMRDLEHYPFKQGWLRLESLGRNSQLMVKFLRQPRTEADKIPPHKAIINGKEVMVGSLVVPTIDLTVPISGKSLAEILSMAGGISPLIGDAAQRSEK